MSIFQSFQTGLALGQEQRKQREVEGARKQAADLYKIGNFEGATTGLMAAGLYDEADAYGRAGDRAKAEKRRKDYGEAFKTGGWTALGETAGVEGDFETVGYAQGQSRAKTLEEWEDRDRKIMEQRQGMEFLATSAANLRNVAPELRGEEAMKAIAQSPFANDPAVMQAVQQAAADGRITDDELTRFEEQMLTYAQRLEGERWQKSFDREGEWRTQDVDWREDQAAEDARRFGLNYRLDERGVALEERKAADAVPQGTGIQSVPGLPPPRQIPTNVPDGVQSTLVRSDDAAIEGANEAAKNADYMARQANLFIERSEGYLPQGEGWLNDLGQITSMRTSDLKNITSDLGPKQREAGSGPMSDRDVEMYKQATVNINNRKGVNTDLSQIYAANAAAAKEYAQFLQEYQAAYPIPGAMRDAKRLWNEYKEAEGNNFMVVDPKTKRVSVNAERPDIYTWLSNREGAGSTGGANDLSTMSDDDLKAALGIR